MTDVAFTSEMRVRCTRVEGTDLDVCLAAWVSTLGDEIERRELWSEKDNDRTTPERQAGLINFLMRDRHGTPFEQVGLQFLTSAPIFVWRQHMKHRIGGYVEDSYNEESARYRKLEPLFYLPDTDRPIVQAGKPGAYEMRPGSLVQHSRIAADVDAVAKDTFGRYERQIEEGIAQEVARMILPVNIYSTAYFRCNLRSLMNFLSLRKKVEGQMFPSFPQREIEMVAEMYEAYFQKHFPMTHAAFVRHGRVAP